MLGARRTYASLELLDAAAGPSSAPAGRERAAGEARTPPVRITEAVTILVVDDDHDHATVMRDILEDQGYRVRVAENGREALRDLLDGPLPDLILLDMMMPQMDGWAFAAELKSRPALAGIPVVAISAGGDAVLYRAPVSAGYLAKPFGASRLLETVARCVSRRRRRDDDDLRQAS
jgi:CheY-like chemotaxis protein